MLGLMPGGGGGASADRAGAVRWCALMLLGICPGGDWRVGSVNGPASAEGDVRDLHAMLLWLGAEAGEPVPVELQRTRHRGSVPTLEAFAQRIEGCLRGDAG